MKQILQKAKKDPKGAGKKTDLQVSNYFIGADCGGIFITLSILCGIVI